MQSKAIRFVSILILAVMVLWLLGNQFPASAASTMYVVVDDGSHLNARDKPKTGRTVARLERGFSVDVVSVKDGWAKISGYSEEEYCYVSSQYLSETPPPEPKPYLITGTGRVRLRDKPNGSKIRWLTPGDEVIVTDWVPDRGETWAKVTYGTTRGYVMADFLSELPTD